MQKVRVRYAPSPTGFAHIGNIRTALYDWLLAKHTGGKFVLRIEDTDRARIVPGSLEEIYESLKWLNMMWDEGPYIGGSHGPYFQSERLNIYDKYASRLWESGHAYYCFCTHERLAEMRKEQEARKETTGYDRICLGISPEEADKRVKGGECGVLRFKAPQEGSTAFRDLVRGEIIFENRLLDDFIIMKSDGYPTYHFASVVDDHIMNITHVIRGEEWISSTPKHVLLYEAFGWEQPAFIHPPLILGPDKSKLSKRHGAVRFLEYKERGFLPEAMINFLALLGWSPGDEQELFSVEELIKRFSLEGIVDHPVVFDIQKLEWMNGVYIRQSDIGRLAELCLPFLQEAGLVPDAVSPRMYAYIRDVTALEQERLKTLSDIVEMARFFFEDEPDYDKKGMNKWMSRDYVPDLLRKLYEKISALDEFDEKAVESAVRDAGEELGLSGGQVIHPTRMAVTGCMAGPGLFETMAVLGRDRVLFRLNRSLDILSPGEAD